jgi:hypothetical protein
LHEARGAEISGDRFEGPGQGAQQGGLAAAVARQQEMCASGKRDRLTEFGERAAVANLKTGVEMNGWDLVGMFWNFDFVAVLAD